LRQKIYLAEWFFKCSFLSIFILANGIFRSQYVKFLAVQFGNLYQKRIL